MNHLIKHNLVRGLPQLNFVQDGLCDSCQQGKQRRITFKRKQENLITDPFHLLHLDLFVLVNIMSINNKDLLLSLWMTTQGSHGYSSSPKRMKLYSTSRNLSR